MRGFYVSALISVLSLGAASVTADNVLVDAVIATVDKEVILYSEIVIVVSTELENIRNTATSQSDYDRRADELIRDYLEEAIESKILLREARKFSIEVTDEWVEKQIDSIRSNYGSEEEFITQAAGGSLSDLREWIRKQRMAQILASTKLRLLGEEIIVSEGDILQYYEDHKQDYERPERVRVRRIFLLASQETKERAKASARLERFREEIEAGAEFEELAKRHSQGPDAELGGLVGWQQRGDLKPALDEAVFSLPIGGTSDVIETLGGVLLLRVDERQEQSHKPLEEVRLEIEPEIRAQAAQKRYQKWLDDLRKRSRVRIFL